MPASRIFIHAGLHKTGTTAIQNLCRKNREFLAGACKWFYLDVEGIPECFIAPQRYPDRSLEDSQKILAQQLSRIPQDQVLISAEGRSGEPGRSYPSHSERLERLVDALRAYDAGLEIHIILITRYQPDFLESYYKQQIQAGGFASPQEFLELLDLKRFRWEDKIQAIEAAISPTKIHVLPYSSKVVEDFFNLLAIDFSQLEKEVYENRSLGVEAIEFARKIHQNIEVPPHLQSRFRKYLQADKSQPLQKRMGGIFDPAARQYLEEFFAGGTPTRPNFLEQRETAPSSPEDFALAATVKKVFENDQELHEQRVEFGTHLHNLIQLVQSLESQVAELQARIRTLENEHK